MQSIFHEIDRWTQAQPLLIRAICDGGDTMEVLHEPNEEALLQLQQMLTTPIEDQATLYELNLLGSVLTNGVELLKEAESDEETCEILRQMLKSSFVIGRRHFNQLV
jgi:hypothetical protein